VRYLGPKTDDGNLATQVDVYTKAQAINAQTAAYTLAASDVGKVVTVNSSSAVNVTVGTGLALSTGQRVDIVQTGTGQVTVVASSTTINGTPGLKLRDQYSAATLLCTGSNTYILIGDLDA
jgi:hypothetical protein